MSLLSNLIPGLSEAQWIGTGVAALALVAGSATVTYKITHGVDQGRYESLVAADARSQTKAVADAAAKQKALDGSGLKAAVVEAGAQDHIVTRTITLTKEIPTYVTVTQDAAASAPGARPGCVSYGLVRLLDAAVLHVEPAALALPAGQSDDSCSPVEPSALASSVAGNYGVADQNAEQLNALIGEVSRQAAIVEAK